MTGYSHAFEAPTPGTQAPEAACVDMLHASCGEAASRAPLCPEAHLSPVYSRWLSQSEGRSL